MPENSSESPGNLTSQLLTDIRKFIGSSAFQQMDREARERAMSDSERLSEFEEVRDTIMQLLLSQPVDGESTRDFLNLKIGGLANFKLPSSSDAFGLRKAVLAFLHDRRELVRGKLLLGPGRLRRNGGGGSGNGCVRNGESSHKTGFRSVHEDAMAEVERLLRPLERARFLNRYCKLNPDNPFLAASFARVAKRSGDRAIQEEALLINEPFLVYKSNLAWFGLLAVTVQDRERMQNAAEKLERDTYLSFNCEVFALLAKDLDDRAKMQTALEALERHLDQRRNASVYGDIAHILGDEDQMRKALEANRPFLADSYNANTFAALAKELDDEDLMREALDALEPHCNRRRSAAAYDSIVSKLAYQNQAIDDSDKVLGRSF